MAYTRRRTYNKIIITPSVNGTGVSDPTPMGSLRRAMQRTDCAAEPPPPSPPSQPDPAVRAVPVNELFFLRTGCVLEDHTTPGGRASRHSAWEIIPQPAGCLAFRPVADEGAIAPCAGEGLPDFAAWRNRQAILLAVFLAQRCRTGVVSLSVGAIPHVEMAGRLDFLVLSASSNGVHVDAYELCRFRNLPHLEPVLHAKWSVELEYALKHNQPSAQNYNAAFSMSYGRNSYPDPDEGHSDICHRHPLELEATQRYLADDLLRRSGIIAESTQPRSSKTAGFSDRHGRSWSAMLRPSTRRRSNLAGDADSPSSRQRKASSANTMAKLKSSITARLTIATMRAQNSPPPGTRRAQTL